jgi:hypothetical protein
MAEFSPGRPVSLTDLCFYFIFYFPWSEDHPIVVETLEYLFFFYSEVSSLCLPFGAARVTTSALFQSVYTF